MPNSTVTRVKIVEALCRKVGLPSAECANILDQLLDVIADHLDIDSSLKISGFGNFTVRQKPERIGRNPKTGEEAPIKSRKVITFRPSPLLRNRMNRLRG